jgi:hypothetical protein
MLPPRQLHIGVALQCLPRFLNVLVEELKLASDKVCLGSISAPYSHIDDIQAAVDRCPH